jgi:uncharacterized protein (DUF736 family)
MSAIGQVTKQTNGGFKGQIKTLSIRADIDIVPNNSKATDTPLRANDVETQTAREFRLGGVEGLHRLCL